MRVIGKLSNTCFEKYFKFEVKNKMVSKNVGLYRICTYALQVFSAIS